MDTKRFHSTIETLILSVLVILSQLIPILAGSTGISYTVFIGIVSLLLFAGVGWAEPAAALIAGLIAPFTGIFQGLYPSVWYALTAAIANGIMVGIISMFQKRSMFLGMLISSVFRFAYCYLIAIKLMPLFVVSAGLEHPAGMGILFCWPQLLGPLAGGLCALPILYYMQLRRETKSMQSSSSVYTK